MGDPLQGLPTDFPSPASQVRMFLADANLVNGTVWPFMEVEPRKYRFQMLNGANSRFYEMSLEPQPGAASLDPVTFHQIGTDSGLLESRVERSSVSLAPADRTDVVVDFSQFNPGDTLLLRNSGPSAVAGTTDEVMQFRIKAPTGPDNSNLPDTLSTIDRYDPQDAVRTRTLELTRTFDEFGRRELLLDGKKWTDANTETIVQGELEIWEFVNRTGNTSHPMHLHMEAFQLLDRETSGGQPIPLEDYELGWEDTVTVGPNETTRIMVKFDQYTGTFVWHCHILEHEDLEMMRTFRIVADGDFDDNGTFDCADIDALTSVIAAGTNDPTYDLTDDGLVDLADRDVWLSAGGAINLPSGNSFLLGDANLDGTVDGVDFLVWNANKFGSTPHWCSGDFNADGNVDGQDFLIWNANKFTSSDTLSSVPEPRFALVLVSGLLCFIRRRSMGRR